MANDVSAPPRRWLVTGAAGFIGVNLARHLLERGEEVVGYDNFFSGTRENVDRLARRFGASFRFVEGDILDPVAFAAAARDCDVLAHIAGQVSVTRSVDDPAETHEINTTGFMNALLAATAGGATHLVYASNCAVYGDNPDLPLTEDARLHLLSPYSATKLANEIYADGMAVLAPSLTVTGLRFFNTFGPWQPTAGGYAAVIPRWIGMILAGERPLLFGDGSATRDFCYVDNTCEAIWLAAGAERGGIYNVATGISTRMDALYQTLRRVVAEAGHNAPIPDPELRPPRLGEVLHSVGSPDKAAQGLNFSPRISLEDGVRRLLAEQYGMTGATKLQRARRP